MAQRGAPKFFVRPMSVVRCLLLGALQLAAIAWFCPGRGLPLDDAWIHQVVARTFAETGTLGYTPGQHGAAATSYLWAALLAVNFKVVHLEPALWALIFNSACAVGAGQWLYALLERARPGDFAEAPWRLLSFTSALVASASPNVLWFACSGMEAMPFIALSLAAVWAATPERSTLRGSCLAGFFAGGLALLRPDAVPLGALLTLYVLIRRGRRQAMVLAFPWVLAVLLYVGSNLAKTGHMLPSTLAGRRWLWLEMSGGLSKSEQALDFLDLWVTRLGSYTIESSSGVVWLSLGICAFGAFVLVRPRRPASRPGVSADGVRLVFAWAASHAALYALLLPTPGHGGRYQPLVPLLFTATLPLGSLFVLRVFGAIVGLQRSGRPLAFAFLACFAFFPWIALGAPAMSAFREANALAVAHIQATELAVGAFLNDLPDGNVASFDIGGSGFVARRRVLDLGGLSDPRTASLLETGRLASWLQAQDVRWVVLPQGYDTTLPVFEDYRTRLHLADAPNLELRAVRTFETPFDRWLPAIRATWNAAPKQVVYEVRFRSGIPPAREVALVSRDALRSIGDPAHLATRRERHVAEHMLATLAAWDVPVEVRLSPFPQSPDARASSSGCLIQLGVWGISLDGCAVAGDPAVFRAMTYEQTGRYLDVGDFGGALRSLVHVVAQVKRRGDPSFQPPLAPLMPPVPGGVRESSMAAGRLGLALALGVLFLALASDAVARRRDRIRERLSILIKRVRGAVLTMLGVTIVFFVGCAGRDVDVARTLVEGRAAVDSAIAKGGSVDEDKATHRVPILEAANLGDADVLSILLSHGAQIAVRAVDGATPLHAAARRGHAGALAVLLAAAPESARGSSILELRAGARQRTALQDAVLSGSLDSVRELLAAGGDATAADAFGQTPLHALSAVDPARVASLARLLLDARGDPTAVDARGFTALHAAAAADNGPLTEMLVKRTESLRDARTPLGETALDVALRYGRDRPAELLFQAGMVPSFGQLPPLHEAARSDALGRAVDLVVAGADLRRKVAGETALEVAVASGSERVASFLRARLR